MYATAVIWLLIPSAILLGSGLLFAYSQSIGSWAHWTLLWPLEALLVGSSIWLTIRLAHRGGDSREWARPLGCTLAIVSAFWAALAVGAVLAAALVGRLFAALR